MYIRPSTYKQYPNLFHLRQHFHCTYIFNFFNSLENLTLQDVAMKNILFEIV